MSSILFTQCLQQDFTGPVGPYEPLPNMLHIGSEESRRLMGEDLNNGAVSRFMNWAHGLPDDKLRIFHIRDWHSSEDHHQKEHLARFGKHCMQDTPGADFVFSLPKGNNRRFDIINSLSLNDFLDSELPQRLDLYMPSVSRIGIIGVWTDVKVHYLAYELRTRYPDAEIAVCSALTASSSRSKHLLALEQMHSILGVSVIHTCGGFMEYLGGTGQKILWNSKDTFFDTVQVETDTILNKTDLNIIKVLFRNSSNVKLSCLDGGFSGNVVVATESRDVFGHQEVTHVVKIGPRESIGKERIAFEAIESVLGNSAPRIADFTDFDERGAIKYRYASMPDGRSRTFQKIYKSGLPLTSVEKILTTVFTEQLGKLYAVSVPQQCDLLSYYEFSPKWAASVQKKMDDIGINEISLNNFLPGKEYYNLASFYSEGLVSIKDRFPESVLFSYVHGDLNGANILVDGNSNVWLIDFFHTHRGHTLRDLIKFENDLLYIFTPVQSLNALKDAVKFSEIICSVEDLASPLPDIESAGIHDENIKRCYATVQILRSFYSPILKTYRNPIQFYIGHLRYAVHTLSFDESTSLQKVWAWYTAGLCARNITSYYLKNITLRIDWLPDEYTLPGRIGLTILPGRKDRNRNIDNDVSVLKENGVTHAVILVTNDELEHYGVNDIFTKYEYAGIMIYHLPILDQMVSSSGEMDALVGWIGEVAANHGKVIIHCLGGLGRSGTVAACFLKRRGLNTQSAVGIVRSIRSGRAIESSIQEAMVDSFS